VTQLRRRRHCLVLSRDTDHKVVTTADWLVDWLVATPSRFSLPFWPVVSYEKKEWGVVGDLIIGVLNPSLFSSLLFSSAKSRRERNILRKTKDVFSLGKITIHR